MKSLLLLASTWIETQMHVDSVSISLQRCQTSVLNPYNTPSITATS